MKLVDLSATECTGVRIDARGKKLWVCVDGQAVLRVKTPKVELADDRDFLEKTHWHKRLVASLKDTLGCSNEDAMKALGKVCSDVEEIYIQGFNSGYEAAEEYITKESPA
jgi:hypothetical protein